MNELAVHAYRVDSIGARPLNRFEQGRECAQPGCITRLSAYNPSKQFCFVHEPPHLNDPAGCAGLPRGPRRPEGVVLDFSEVKDGPRGIPRPQAEHGTYAGYKAGCRCHPCRDADAAYKRQHRARKAAMA